MSSSPTTLIRRYEGSCVTFNLVQASRVKKNGLGKETGEEELSEEWVDTNNDDGRYLIVRLIFEKGTHPWLVCHHGIYEAFKGPLLIPVVKVEEKKELVTMHLRDFANRGGSQCIRRKFYLKFGSLSEAEGFTFLHNFMLSEFDKEKREKIEEAIPAAADSSQDTIDLLNSSGDGESDNDAGSCNLSSDCDNSMQEQKANNASYEKKLEMFKQSAGPHDFFDDMYENTQDPFSDSF